MSMKLALRIILAISVGGVAFSGYLTYGEFFGGEPSCSPVGQPGTILGYPPCLYGLGMYLAVAVLALWGLKVGEGGRRARHREGPADVATPGTKSSSAKSRGPR